MCVLPIERFRFLIGLIPCVAALLMCGCGETNTAADRGRQPGEVPTIAASTLVVDLQRWPTVVRCQGSLFPDEQAVVGAKVGGRVDSVHVEIGDAVEQADPLATLDQQEAQLRVLQAEAQLRQARSTVGLSEGQSAENLDPVNAAPVREAKAVWDEGVAAFKRAKMLKDRDAFSDAEFDQAAAVEQVGQAQYASSLNSVAESLALIGVREAELSIARQQLADAIVRSPFSGYVQQRQTAPGAYVATGQPIAVVVRTTPLRFRGAVPERFAQSLRLGQEVRLTIQSVSTPVVAAVTRISPMLDSRSRTLMFEAEIPNEDQQLRTGLFAEAEVVIDPDATAIVLPESSIVEFAGNQKVWRVIEGVASEHTITTSERRAGFRRVAEGLEIGDRILIDGDQGLVAMVIEPPANSSVASKSESTIEYRGRDVNSLQREQPTERRILSEPPELPADDDAGSRKSS